MRSAVENVIEQIIARDVPDSERAAAREAWGQVAENLHIFQSVAFQKANPTSLENQELLGNLNPKAASELGDVMRQLEELLFAEVVNIGGERFALIEFLTRSDLGDFQERIGFVTSPDTELGPGWVHAVLAMCVKWLEKLSDQSPVTRYQKAIAGVGGAQRLNGVVPGYFIHPLIGINLGAAADHWHGEIARLASAIRTLLLVTNAVKKTEDAAKRAGASAKAATDAAGATGANELADHFAALTTKERDRAKLWTGITAGAIVLTVAIAAGVIVDGRHSGDEQWQQFLVKLALTIPVIAGGIYASRIASRHREQAWTADLLAVQLRTLPAFIDPMPAEAREELRSDFGRRLFGAITTTGSKGDTPDSTSITNAVTEALKAVRSSEK